MKSYLVFDLESTGAADADDYLEPVSAPSNWKDEEKIAAYIEEKRAELIARAALDCDLNRIVAIGFMRANGLVEVFVSEDETAEKQALAAFWNAWTNVDGPKVNFNALLFDLPVLIRRSQLLGVKHPNVSLDRYRTPVVDLMQYLTWRGAVKAKSLSFYCKRFGIQAPADEFSGKDIPLLVEAGDYESVAAHCRADVIKTAALAVRLGIISDADWAEVA